MTAAMNMKGKRPSRALATDLSGWDSSVGLNLTITTLIKLIERNVGYPHSHALPPILVYLRRKSIQKQHHCTDDNQNMVKLQGAYDACCRRRGEIEVGAKQLTNTQSPKSRAWNKANKQLGGSSSKATLCCLPKYPETICTPTSIRTPSTGPLKYPRYRMPV